MTTIYLLRHGQIPTTRPRRFVGRQDLPLTAQGRHQMAQMAAFLASRSIDRVVCSPLDRCRESAAIVGARQGAAPEVNRQLAEINLGAWEGLTAAEVEERYPGQYQARGRDISGFRPEGGESFQDLLDRAWPAFESLGSTAGTSVAIVAHAGINRVLLCRILGMPLANLFLLDQSYGCANIISRDSGRYLVHCLNYRPGSDPQ